jgi:hypothetical protein
MSDYLVKIRIPFGDPHDFNCRFEVCHYGSEPSDYDRFKHELMNNTWRAGFRSSDWEHADRIWIFGLKEVFDK